MCVDLFQNPVGSSKGSDQSNIWKGRDCKTELVMGEREGERVNVTQKRSGK